MPEQQGLCESCKELKPVAWTDSVGREYCQGCIEDAKQAFVPSPTQTFMALTIPFKVGDRVECRTGGTLYTGIGVIDQVSTDLENFGTPFHPSFHVVFEQKAYPDVPDAIWYMEQQIQKVEA